jgi:ubiquinone/menaquinone biosynthesis C-methylase UbiE
VDEVYRRLYQFRFFARFYSRLAGRASVALFSQSLNEQMLRYLPPGAKVLEVGCGPGLQAIDVSFRRPDINLVASDFSDEFVQLGRENLRLASGCPGSGRPLHSSLSFVQADAMDLSVFPEASFDAVYSLTAIKHFPDPERGISECLRVLKPGGRLVLAEFDRDSALVDMVRLAGLMGAPTWLQPVLARLIHAGVRHEAPSRQVVRKWLSAANIAEDDYNLTGITGYPAWIATIRKLREFGTGTIS